NTQWHFAELTQQDALHWLAYYVEGYYRGLRQPLLLLPGSGWAWIKRSYDPVSGQINPDQEVQRKAREELIQVWQGTQQMPGEAEDPYIRRLLPTLESQTTDVMIAEAQHYLLPLINLLNQQ
ncbi:MAG: exodeoxyribonuclease V subunit gamma, partial [Enterobacteriaceae bacterium]